MHPGDFTPVCTTELGKAANLESKFADRNVKLVGFSCNDAASHVSWIEDIKAVTGGQVDFPMFCDPDRKFAVELGILDKENADAAGLPQPVRSVYVLKPDKTVALTITYPASTGRNFDEILRVVDSLQMTSDSAVATPVNWKVRVQYGTCVAPTRRRPSYRRYRRPPRLSRNRLSGIFFYSFARPRPQKGEDVIVNFPLTNADAEEKFGKDGFRIVKVPSEEGKDGLAKNYLRYTKDPSAGFVRRLAKKIPVLGKVF